MTMDPSWCPPAAASDSSAGATNQDRRQLIGDPPAPGSCHVPMTAMLLTGVLCDFVRNRFSQPESIETVELRKLIWTAEASTAIMIESVLRWRAAMVEKRPAALIRRNGYRSMRLAIGDKQGVLDDGAIAYQTLWVGSHTVFVLSEQGLHCVLLAEEIRANLHQFAPNVRSKYNLMRLQVTEVGAVGTIKEAAQVHAVPITVGWAFEERWNLYPLTPPLAGVAVTLTGQ